VPEYVLGLDVGITSVGWGIIDLENSQVIAAGSRLFSEGTAKNNEDRRGKRSSRRLLRRRNYRLKRMTNLLVRNNIINQDFKPLENPYEIRKKGLNTKLTNEELATAILHIAKRRGISGDWIDEINPEKVKENQTTKAILNEKREFLANNYVCEYQLAKFNEGIRGKENFFETKDYIKEIEAILKNQKLKPELEKEIKEIIQSKRDYDTGPGDEHSPTKYGRWYYNEYGQIVETPMIEKMRGKCSVYSEELRAPKMSYHADVFNILNDLNNIEIFGEKITTEEKEIIIDIIDHNGKFTIADLKKMYKLKDYEGISGARIDKNKNPLLTEFKGLKNIMKLVNDNDLSEIIYQDKKLFDNIIETLTNQKSKDNREKELLEKHRNVLTDKDIEYLSQASGITSYHSLSTRIIKELTCDLIETNDNQMQLLQAKGLFKNKNDLKGKKQIPVNNELILSPVAKRAQAEALKIVNAVRSKYGELDTIVVEMARDKNSDEKKKRETNLQKRNENTNKQVLEELKKANPNMTEKDISAHLALKARLYMEQDGKCLYTGKTIDLNVLIADKYAYEVDHIIPESISFDNSYTNKVLVLKRANQEKGQRTPYKYFKNKVANGWNYEDFKNFVNSSKSIPRNKKQNLLFEKDIDNYEVRRGFINSNLVDTRYASRGLLNTLMDYFKDNELDTKVHTIKGTLTNNFRKKAQIDKDRDEDFKHHAVDALIVAGIKKMNYFDNLLGLTLIKEDDKLHIMNKETGEVITSKNEKEYYDHKFLEFIQTLRDIKVNYSHKVDRKYNRAITTKETIYSTRVVDDKEYKISKFGDIYGDEGKKLAESFRKHKAHEQLLMYEHDRVTFDLLKAVVEQYKNDDNPFLRYYQDNNDYIRKHGKKTGPIIKSVKYKDGVIATGVLDLSHKYEEKPKNNKRAILTSMNPFRIDIYLEDDKYKFLRICHHNISYKHGKPFINPSFYKEEKINRKISDKAEFKFSLNKGDLFYYYKSKDDNRIVRYNGLSYEASKIEYKDVNTTDPKQTYLAIGTFKQMYKYNADVLGNLYKVDKESCKLELDLL